LRDVAIVVLTNHLNSVHTKSAASVYGQRAVLPWTGSQTGVGCAPNKPPSPSCRARVQQIATGV